MASKRSTLFTNPRSAGDFAVRVVFFAFAPIAIVGAAAFFPVNGALVSVALALIVFLLGESIRARAGARPLLARLLRRQLAFEAYYRARPPRPFLYYVFYPLLFPYWLINRDARAEFWLFKGYTLLTFGLLVGSVVSQYFTYWPPDLGLRDFLPVLGMTFAVEWFLVLALLMPIATTVVGLHASMRRGRLVALLVIGLISTGLATARLVGRRDPIVSFATRERVTLRSGVDPKRAHDAQIAALAAAWKRWREAPGTVYRDGKIEGAPLDAAHAALQRFYKPDESFAFDLWMSTEAEGKGAPNLRGSEPRRDAELLVLYFPARRRRPAMWAAMRRDGVEIADAKQLPEGAFAAMRRAAER